MRLILFLTISMLSIVYAGSAERLSLDNSNDINDAITIDNVFWDLSKKVSQCMEAKQLSYSKCVCSHPKSLHALQMHIKHTLQKHPEWRDKTLVYTYKHSGYNTNISAIIRHFLDEKMCETNPMQTEDK